MEWKQLLESIAISENPSKLWRLIQSLNNTYTNTPDTHEAITTNNNTIPSPKNSSNYVTHTTSPFHNFPHHPTDKAIDRTHRRKGLSPSLPFHSSPT